MTNLQKSTDTELIAAILKQDNMAMGELYSRYYQKVFQKCLTMVRDHDQAFDLAEESLIKAFDNLPSFRGVASFSTWLYTITHRHCLEALRKEKKKNIKNNVELEESNEPLMEAGESIEVEEREAMMLALIDALPDEEKNLLLLKYNEGETIESLQRSMEVSSSAIKMRLMRTKEKLNHLYTLATIVGLQAVLSQLETL